MLKIIFVCKDNLTRSVAAELATKKYLTENHIYDITASSAGIDLGKFDKIYTAHFDELQKMGMGEEVSKHKQKTLKADLIDASTLLIAMGKDHKEYLEKNYSCRTVLFSKLAYNKDESVTIDWQKPEEIIDEQLRSMVREMYRVAPVIIEKALDEI
jgi:protein-tyrosine-phosphatase